MNFDSSLFHVLLITAGELILFVLYWAFGMYRKGRVKDHIKSVLKGIFERAFLTLSFVFDFSVALVFFSALKLGTRLDEDSKNKFSNDQFLIGNMVSVLAAFLYSLLLQ
jgi:hypothetical protein